MSIIFIGSYTEMLAPNFGGHGEGISTLKFNDITGELHVINTTSTTNPGYLALSENGHFLYAVKEVVLEKMPMIKAYRVHADHTLELINEQPIHGGLPCHIAYHNAAVFVTCYETGNLFKFPLDTTGKLLPFSHQYKHTGSSINAQRQEAPHPHQITIHDDKHAYVPDLGIDKIKVYDLIEDDLKPNASLDIDIPAGSGPRHIVFKKNTGYLINELSGTISILKKENQGFSFSKDVKSLPNAFTDLPSASAIRVHPNLPLLYAANRTLDAITIFTIVDDDLKLLGYEFTKGKTLREFNISPDGKWLIVCLQDSDEIIVYHIQPDGSLLEKHRTTEVASPVCLVFN